MAEKPTTLPKISSYGDRNMRLAYRSQDLADIERAQLFLDRERAGTVKPIDVSKFPDKPLTPDQDRRYRLHKALQEQQTAFLANDQVELAAQNERLLALSQITDPQSGRP